MTLEITKINYSEEDREIFHSILDKVMDDGEEIGILQNASVEDFQIKIKQYRLLIHIDNERRL